MLRPTEADTTEPAGASSPDVMLSLLDKAAEGRMADPELRVEVAGSRFGIAGEASLRARLMAALNARSTLEQPDLRILVWSGMPSPLAKAPPHWRAAERWARKEAVRAAGPWGWVYFDPYGEVAILYDAARHRAGMWFANPGSPAQWLVAAPFLRIFDSWFVPQRKLMCHGAAIARSDTAALIVGPGGAGKSTLAIQAMAHGFGYIGDDYVLLDASGDAPTVHSIYRSGKLFPADARAGIPADVTVAACDDDLADKYLLSIAPDRLVAAAPIRAVIAPRLGGDEPAIDPISPAAALQMLMPSVFQQLVGAEQAKLAIAARIARIPCYRLSLSRDHGRNLALVGRLLDAAR